MRRVLRNHNEVCHYWANRRQSEGRAGNIFFDGDTIYSYGTHFPMARLYPFSGVAFTTKSYSVSTAKHMCLAARAARHLTRVDVANPTVPAANQLVETQREIAELLDKARRARQRKPLLMSQALKLADDFNTYAEWRGESVRIDTGTLDTLREELAAADEREEERRRQAAAAYEAAAASDIANWVAGLRLNCPWTAQPKLRLGHDAEGREAQIVETSWGAVIPLSDANRLWPVIQRVMTGERDYEVGMDLGGYRLTKIRRDGSIVVGCHDIAYSEIERIAKQLGLLETEAA